MLLHSNNYSTSIFGIRKPHMKGVSKTYSLLLVDDSEIVSERVASMISDYCSGYHIFFAKTSTEAYQQLKNNNFDFIIADIQLEGKKRFDMIRFIKRMENAPKIIVLTNQVSQQHKNICLGLGADFFVDKSVDFEKIPEMLTCEDVEFY